MKDVRTITRNPAYIKFLSGWRLFHPSNWWCNPRLSKNPDCATTTEVTGRSIANDWVSNVKAFEDPPNQVELERPSNKGRVAKHTKETKICFMHHSLKFGSSIKALHTNFYLVYNLNLSMQFCTSNTSIALVKN